MVNRIGQERVASGETSPGMTVSVSQKAGESIIQALQGASDSVIITDGGRIIYLNEATSRLIGYQPAELYAADSIVELVIEDDQPRLQGKLKHPHQIPRLLDLTLRRKDGTTVMVTATVSAVAGDGERRILILRDGGNAPVQETDSVRDNERMYRSLFDPEATDVIVQSPEGALLYAGERIREVFGWEDVGPETAPAPPELVTAEGVPLHPDEQPRMVVAATGEPLRDFVVGLNHETSDERWFSIDAFPLFSAEGDLVQVFANLTDITESRNGEEDIRSNEARMRLAMEASSAGTWEAASGSGEIHFRDRAMPLFGATLELLAEGFYPLEMIDAANREQLESEIKRAYAEGNDVDITFPVTWPDETEHRLKLVGSIDSERERMVGLVMEDSNQDGVAGGVGQNVIHDPLTKLPTRALLQDRLMQAVLNFRRDGKPVALLAIHIDNFDEINESFGQYWGDRVIQVVGERLRAHLRENDTVARMEGETFAVVAAGADLEGAPEVARKIVSAFESSIMVDDREMAISVSVGAAVCPDHGTEAEILMRRADLAVKRVRGSETSIVLFGSEEPKEPVRDSAIVNELRAAIEENQLSIDYLPKVKFAGRSITAMEALVRWKHPTDGVLMPERFVGAMEQAGLTKPLIRWVLATSLEQSHIWQLKGFTAGVAVNVSGGVLAELDLPEMVSELLETHRVEPGRLELEIDEAMITSDPEAARAVIGQLQEMGVVVALISGRTAREAVEDRPFLCQRHDDE